MCWRRLFQSHGPAAVMRLLSVEVSNEVSKKNDLSVQKSRHAQALQKKCMFC